MTRGGRADDARQPEGDPQTHLNEALRRKERRAVERNLASFVPPAGGADML
jgi:hypothetical protein